MKRLLTGLLCALLLCSLAACSISGTETTEASHTETTEAELTYEEVMALLQVQNAVAVNPQVHKDLENDGIYLSADVQNNITGKFSVVTIAFAAWDFDGNPIKLQSYSGLTEDSYIKEVSMGDVAVEAGQLWAAEEDGSVTGYRVADTQSNISYVRACVVSFVAEDGGNWSNPYYYDWRKQHFGQTLNLPQAETTEDTTESIETT